MWPLACTYVHGCVRGMCCSPPFHILDDLALCLHCPFCFLPK